MRTIYSILFILTLYSCSSNWHLNKAIKKGANIEKIVEHRRDTTWLSEHHYVIDTSRYEHTIVKYVPETRWRTRIETRFEHKRFKDSLRASQKRFKDSLRHYRTIYSDSLRNALKTAKIENRTERKKDNRLNRFLFWFMAFFVILLIIYILAKTLADKLLK